MLFRSPAAGAEGGVRGLAKLLSEPDGAAATGRASPASRSRVDDGAAGAGAGAAATASERLREWLEGQRGARAAPGEDSAPTVSAAPSPAAATPGAPPEQAAPGAGAGAGAAAGAPGPLGREAARRAAWRLLLGGCRRGGAAFIKWGQWASVRPDMFPADFCEALSSLHDDAPAHPWAETERQVVAELGRPVDEVFSRFDRRPLASGSIAQVHRAVLRPRDGRPAREVAVKVRHPGVARAILEDFALLKPLAAAVSRVRALRGLNLKESVDQFSHTMTAQTDLRVEAVHLARAGEHFGGAGSRVVAPRPLDGLASASVLVESFEPGHSVARYIREPSPLNGEIVSLGVDAYLQMLLADNFVHTDLHPGNIMCREGADGRVELVLLDYGLAEELTPRVRRHFVGFLMALGRADGARAAWHLLRWRPGGGGAGGDTSAFEADMARLFRDRCDVRAAAGIDVDAVLKATLALCRRHEVCIDSQYAALVVGVCVIVGFATSLDPAVNMMDAAIPCFFAYRMTGRVMGGLFG